MTEESINASIVAARLTGHINAMIQIADMAQDYDSCITHLKVLISVYTNNEYNRGCHEWIREWNLELKKYERLRITNIKK